MASDKRVTVGFLSHRPEMVALVSQLMRQHDAIILEEPPAAGFDEMLAGKIGIDEYTLSLDLEFPEFGSKMCRLLRQLKAEGKKIYQVEPYMAVLMGIHEFFAAGQGPGNINKESIEYPVYLAEKNATGALLAYYQAASKGTFEETIEAVKQFAQRDAARFRLRDSLRCQHLLTFLEDHPSVFIEAGEMHYPVYPKLRNSLPDAYRVKPVFIAAQAMKKMNHVGHVFGPGDLLTLLYIYHPNIRQPKREDLMAARSLIHAKLVTKVELNENLDSLPHLRNEVRCNLLVSRLDQKDCKHLFYKIRKAGTRQANRLVADFIDQRMSHAP